ncbi:beta-ketoacyl-ACP synthase III [Pseudodesulfovibrio senegalensis]|uniref:Beta-ketoacyl-[acyl-carrier-protein] synthase III n=1 Tax=Pseudodesulfovibrio senegalensis TaxID=1721087 RepID=A0A6N6N3I0_9BACT|nr:beta-ketoacyl-ACP synthase III [Pseudodesulfovibrio senegalensis]KAB1442117.1 ketoacyl-ACP synthase III [Pseudodesulfovibrio senegalensis]
MSNDIVIRGLGRHVPEKILTNADFEAIVDTSDEWITTRTGIKERHVVSEGEYNSDLAVGAARMALKNAGMEAEELTHIIMGTITADHVVPSGACVVQEKLGLKHRVAYDISAACSGFIFGLENARAILALHPEAKVLVIGVEVLTHRTNFEDRSTCVLFGDGAGAAILTQGGEGPKLLDVKLSTDGSLANLLTVSGGGSAATYKLGDTVGPEYFIQMQGREIFKHAVRSMTGICNQILEDNNLTNKDVDVLIPHQANWRIIDAVGRKFEIPAEQVYSNVQRFGNTSAASVPLALSEADETGFLKEGNLVMLTAFGGGFTWASALLQY